MVHGRDLWPVKVDISQFEQVIVNLAVNARDAMPDGGRLTVRTANVTAPECARYHAKGMPAADYVLVEVTDTGTGIPATIVDKIFEPFFSTKEVGKGTGLGLSTVYGIIKQTGGFVYVDSAEGKGATFRIFLPRHVAECARDCRRARRRGRSAGDRCALAAGRGQARRQRRSDRRGHHPAGRGRGRACASSMPAGSPRAAIPCSRPATASRRSRCWRDTAARSISWCPTWSCRKWTARRCCANCAAAIPSLKIIFVSGYAEDAFQKHLPADGQFAFLPKPFTLKQLVNEVKETMAA